MFSEPGNHACSLCGHDDASQLAGTHACPRCGRLLPDVTEQLGDFVDDELLLSTIPGAVALQTHVLPIRWSDTEITLASDLSQPDLVAKLGFILARRVRLHYAEPNVLLEAIRSAYKEGDA